MLAVLRGAPLFSSLPKTTLFPLTTVETVVVRVTSERIANGNSWARIVDAYGSVVPERSQARSTHPVARAPVHLLCVRKLKPWSRRSGSI